MPTPSQGQSNGCRADVLQDGANSSWIAKDLRAAPERLPDLPLEEQPTKWACLFRDIRDPRCSSGHELCGVFSPGSETFVGEMVPSPSDFPADGWVLECLHGCLLNSLCGGREASHVL